MAKIAISYRRADSAPMAYRIRDRLAARYGSDAVFIDIVDIPSGVPFHHHVQKVWSEIDVLLALIGRNWLRGARLFSFASALRYLAVPAFLLLVAHHLIVNSLDIDTLWLRIVAFLLPLPFGAALYWQTRAKPIAAFGIAAMLGVIAAAAMIVSTSLRYQQPILPASAYEWWESIEYVLTIALGFWAGTLLARLPGVPALLGGGEDWVRHEIEIALAQKTPVIPVLLDDAVMPASDELPEKMRPIVFHNAVQVRSGLDFDTHMARLIAGIDQILAAEKS
jgi:hypothetical protein